MRIYIILGLFLLIACGNVLAAGNKGLQLSVSFDKEEYTKNDPILMDFTLKNAGKTPVYVNKRCQIASKDSLKEDREIYLTVIGPDGQELPYKAQPYKMSLPKSDYFALVKPGEEATSERKMNLKGFFEINTPGEYKVTVVYQNSYGKEIGIDAVKDEIKSKPVTLKIKE